MGVGRARRQLRDLEDDLLGALARFGQLEQPDEGLGVAVQFAEVRLLAPGGDQGGLGLGQVDQRDLHRRDARIQPLHLARAALARTRGAQAPAQ